MDTQSSSQVRKKVSCEHETPKQSTERTVKRSMRLRSAVPKYCNNCTSPRKTSSTPVASPVKAVKAEAKIAVEPPKRSRNRRSSRNLALKVTPLPSKASSAISTRSFGKNCSGAIAPECVRPDARFGGENTPSFSSVYPNRGIMSHCKLSSDTTVVSINNFVPRRLFGDESFRDSVSASSETSSASCVSPLTASLTESEAIDSYMDLVDLDLSVPGSGDVPLDLEDVQVDMPLSSIVRDCGINFFADLYHIDRDIDENFFDLLL